jgi:two-component system sensor kinase FixL
LEQESGDGWAEGVHPDDYQRCLEVYVTAFDARRTFKMEYRLRRADGEYRWIVDNGVPHHGVDGSFKGYIGSCHDITDIKRAESELQRHRAELAHVSRISIMGELAASLAHELNQPLTAIQSNAQAAQRFLTAKPATPAVIKEIAEILRDIVQDNNRASEIIRRLRALAGKGELDFSPLDLAGAIREVVVLVHSDAVLHNVQLSLTISDGLPRVLGDKIQLQQVMLNLLLNAFDAMKDCPADERRVIVRVDLDKAGMIRGSICDRGTGLAGDMLDKIFEPFYTTKREGLGMGLSISRSIIKAHGGQLWAENNPDRGATFYFTVPAAETRKEQVTTG